MLKRVDDTAEFVALPELGVLRIHGADMERFLQGQLSNDVARLASGTVQLTGYHNPQGRVLAVLYLVRTAPEELFAVLPRELAATVAQRLSKFILRAKVKIEDLSAEWHVEGLIGQAEPLDEKGPGVWGRFSDGRRTLHLQPASGAGAARGDAQQWRALAIERGEPQVYGATTEEFVSQMLNLDLLGAIAFDKGCYTGQEVIARAHYRGRVKRRMQRFLARGAATLAPGSVGRLTDGRSFKVVHSVRSGEEGCEFLAVTALAPRDEAGSDAQAALTEAQALPLPYALPE
jgi:folate-binding protein YgfZ